MTVTIKENGEQTVVVLVGELDTVAATETEKALQQIMQGDKKDIVLDCTEMPYIASSGLRLFLALLKAVKNRGGMVTLKGVNDDIMSVLKVTGFDSMFKFA